MSIHSTPPQKNKSSIADIFRSLNAMMKEIDFFLKFSFSRLNFYKTQTSIESYNTYTNKCLAILKLTRQVKIRISSDSARFFVNLLLLKIYYHG